MRFLYKYPQRPFPYELLVRNNQQRGRASHEFELHETGIFDDRRYFDVFVEYAKADAEDLLIEITIANRGFEPADLHVLPTVWFRNTWAWSDSAVRPRLSNAGRTPDAAALHVEEPTYGSRWLYTQGAPAFLFTDNETNKDRLFGTPGPRFTKDGINDWLVEGRREAINPAEVGTKAWQCIPRAC